MQGAKRNIQKSTYILFCLRSRTFSQQPEVSCVSHSNGTIQLFLPSGLVSLLIFQHPLRPMGESVGFFYLQAMDTLPHSKRMHWCIQFKCLGQNLLEGGVKGCHQDPISLPLSGLLSSTLARWRPAPPGLHSSGSHPEPAGKNSASSQQLPRKTWIHSNQINQSAVPILNISSSHYGFVIWNLSNPSDVHLYFLPEMGQQTPGLTTFLVMWSLAEDTSISNANIY